MATKLCDSVRRKCFNCHTVETSIWRRSKLSPGKVVCNRCRLYERDYSRHRPVAQSRACADESSERDDGVSQNESGKQRLSRGDAEVSFTDDMKTELSDGVRRRCFNCRTIPLWSVGQIFTAVAV
ncbi:hypothetical protein FB45DRAFT_124205 [Roridomyces roridus]|uniref:GATA-type domain-containing protein n=1 Tax=Roridomyces roridus TaxID=1738132 RepID=A0AAD7BJ15_9AGAR|nr:hypothetical protein FB45DRAFT_124205 [Roridomyces roridus]